MNHFTSEELVSVLTKIRNQDELTSVETNTLKMYIPLHLDSEQAQKMQELVEDIRTGRREPLSDDERIALHKENMEQTMKNILVQIPLMSEDQFIETCKMCEVLRQQIAR